MGSAAGESSPRPPPPVGPDTRRQHHQGNPGQADEEQRPDLPGFEGQELGLAGLPHRNLLHGPGQEVRGVQKQVPIAEEVEKAVGREVCSSENHQVGFRTFRGGRLRLARLALILAALPGRLALYRRQLDFHLGAHRKRAFLVGFGIESGSPKMLKLMDKGQTVDQIKNAVNICRKLDMDMKVQLVIPEPQKHGLLSRFLKH